MTHFELPFNIKIEPDDEPVFDVTFDGGPFSGRRIIAVSYDPDAYALIHDFGWRDGPEWLEEVPAYAALEDLWHGQDDPETGQNPYASLRDFIEAGGGPSFDGMGQENGVCLSDEDIAAILEWLDELDELED